MALRKNAVSWQSIKILGFLPAMKIENAIPA